jgi:hypothetical protein
MQKRHACPQAVQCCPCTNHQCVPHQKRTPESQKTKQYAWPHCRVIPPICNQPNPAGHTTTTQQATQAAGVWFALPMPCNTVFCPKFWRPTGNPARAFKGPAQSGPLQAQLQYRHIELYEYPTGPVYTRKRPASPVRASVHTCSTGNDQADCTAAKSSTHRGTVTTAPPPDRKLRSMLWSEVGGEGGKAGVCTHSTGPKHRSNNQLTEFRLGSRGTASRGLEATRDAVQLVNLGHVADASEQSTSEA